MASGTILGTTSNEYVEAKIEWHSVANNLENRSTVVAELWYRRTNEYYTAGKINCSISINGKTFTPEKKYWIEIWSDWVMAMRATTEVDHLADGTQNVFLRAEGWVDGTSLTYTLCYGTVDIDTIPRASTISATYKTDLGSPCKVTWTPYVKSYNYKLEFSCGKWKHTTDIIRPGTTSLYTYEGYTFPYEVAEQFPSSTNGVMNVTLYTYEDAGVSQVGGSSTSAFFVYLPENADTKPKVTMTLSPVTPYEKFKSLYLRGLSKVQATFSGEGKYRATVDYYNMSVEGKSYDSPHESDILNTAGKVTVVGTGRDSRYFTNTDTEEINVIAYDAPYISTYPGYNRVICERCTQDGTVTDSGTCLHVKGTRNYTKINTDGIVNNCSVKCRYRPEGSDDWSPGEGEGVIVLGSGDTTEDAFDVILTDINLNPAVIYKVELNIVDDISSPKAMEFDIASEYVDFEFREGGRGIGLGKHAAEANLLDCDWDARFRQGIFIGDGETGHKVVDLVVGEGTTDIWYYRKWLSGKAECWGRRRVSVNISDPWGAIYYTSVNKYEYPSGLFTSEPMCQVTAEFGANMQGAWLAVGGDSTAEYTPGSLVCRPNTKEGVSLDILYYAIGEWK